MHRGKGQLEIAAEKQCESALAGIALENGAEGFAQNWDGGLYEMSEAFQAARLLIRTRGARIGPAGAGKGTRTPP